MGESAASEAGVAHSPRRGVAPGSA